MKNFYDIEKEKLENRITEEKERGNRRMGTAQDEFKLKLQDEVREKDHTIECLQNQLLDLEQQQENYNAQVEHEMSIKQKTIEGLELQLQGIKEKLSQAEQTKVSSFERQIEHFEQQRVELNSRIDKLTQENIDKDKQLAQLNHQLDRKQDSLDRKTVDFDQTKE